MREVLCLKQVSQIFHAGTEHEVKALDNVDLTVGKKDFIIVIGGNGSGKSSLMKAIFSGIMTKGSVFLNDVEITGMPEFQRAGLMGFITQHPEEGTIGEFSILENLVLSGLKQNQPSLKRAIGGGVQDKYKDIVASTRLGLEKRIDSPVCNLSGGERQVVSVLMALTGSPAVLLCDEATASIDIERTLVIEDLVKEFCAERDIPVIWITHDPEQVLRIGNRVVVLKEGRIYNEILEEEKKKLTINDISNWIKGN